MVGQSEVACGANNKSRFENRIRAWRLFANKIDRENGCDYAEHISEFVASLQTKQRKVSSINSALRAVRRVFRLALKWGLPDTDQSR